MGKANKSKPSQGRPGKSCKRADMKSIDKVKFRVKKGNVKQKQGRSVTRSDYQKKVSYLLSDFTCVEVLRKFEMLTFALQTLSLYGQKLQNQQFESIKSLNTKSDQIQDAIRSSAVVSIVPWNRIVKKTYHFCLSHRRQLTSNV